eukprot:5296424-Pyramimonas_sp.AAC.1
MIISRKGIGHPAAAGPHGAGSPSGRRARSWRCPVAARAQGLVFACSSAAARQSDAGAGSTPA